MSHSLLQFAQRSWPAAISAAASIAPVTARRLSDDPLFRIERDGQSYALRGWKKDRIRQANAAARFTRHVLKSRVLCVPVPLVSPSGESLVEFQGRFWELAPWLEGESGFEQHPSAARIEAMCHSLALLHQEAATLEFAREENQSEPRTPQLAELAGSLDAGEFVLNPEQLDLPADVCSSLRQAIERVERDVRLTSNATQSRQWIWGDAWQQNFLFDGDRVTGLVDFATVRVDTPLADIARLLGSATTDHPDWWPRGLDSYSSVRPLCPADCETTRLLADVGTVISLGNWLRWLGVERREFASRSEALARLHHFHRRLTELLARTDPP